jgi:hypothetical protein
VRHQVISLDRTFASNFATPQGDNANAFPLIVAAHDHEPYLEVRYLRFLDHVQVRPRESSTSPISR